MTSGVEQYTGEEEGRVDNSAHRHSAVTRGTAMASGAVGTRFR